MRRMQDVINDQAKKHKKQPVHAAVESQCARRATERQPTMSLQHVSEKKGPAQSPCACAESPSAPNRWPLPSRDFGDDDVEQRPPRKSSHFTLNQTDAWLFYAIRVLNVNLL